MLFDIIGFLSDFGDQNIICPFIITIIIFLVWQKRYPILFVWLGLVIVTFGVLVGAKLWFEACGRVSESQLYSPSGHTTGATFVYGSTLLLFARSPKMSFVCAIIVAMVMGFTRVWVHAHNLVEIIVGAGIGLIDLFILAIIQQKIVTTHLDSFREPWIAIIGLGLCFLILTITLHGIRSPAEHWIENWSHVFMSKFERCSTEL